MIKSTFARFPQLSGDISNVLERVWRVDFEFGEGIKCIGAFEDHASLYAEIVQRKPAESRKYDDAERKVIVNKTVREKITIFAYSYTDSIASCPGSFRDFAVFAEAMERSGAGKDFTPVPIAVSLIDWVRAVLKMYPTAQLGGVVVGDLFMEPRNIGTYSYKTVDNRIDMEALQTVAGQLKSIKLGFFHEGVRRSVQATAKGTLTVTSSDDEDAEHFFAEQRGIMLEHSTAEVG